MKPTRQEKRLLQSAESFTKETGIAMEQHSFDIVSSREKIFVCLIRGLIIYLTVLGVFGLFISSFELPCNQIFLFFIGLILSLLIAFLYYNKILFNLGYIAILFVFLAFAIFFRVYANSGFNAILNIILNAIDERMNLGGVRQYTEFISNRYLAITICLILILFFAICFFNSTISGYMSPVLLFIQLMPIVQICIYLNDDVNYFYCFCLLAAWLSVCIINRSNRFRINLKKQALFYRNKKKQFYYEQKSIFGSILGLLITCLAVGLLLISVTYGIAKATPYRMRNNESVLKKESDEFVSEFALNGILGFFNQYTATGGMSGGRLGGVRSVMMDFEEDLRVTYVPYNTNPLYLKGYVGEVYSSHQWDKITRLGIIDPILNYESDWTVNKEYQLLIDRFFNRVAIFENDGEEIYSPDFPGKNEKFAYGKMQITNTGASPEYLYRPYYAEIPRAYVHQYRGDVVDGVTPPHLMLDYLYSPLLYPSVSMIPKSTYDGGFYYLLNPYIQDTYCQVPKGIRAELKKICREQGFYDADNWEEAVRMIQKYFYDNFHYSLNPGKTPDNKDFATYFLNKQKNGYCAHFATAGCLLLRTLGYPARYVEGYALDVGAQEDAEVNDEDISDWYMGYNELGDYDELKVLTFSVTDASAHAWVEVYQEDFGWVPVEFTVAEEQSFGGNDGFWSRFQNYLSGESDTDSPIQLIVDGFKTSKSTLSLGFVLFLVVIVAIILINRLKLRYRLYRNPSNARLVHQYSELTELLHRYSFADKGNIYHEDAKQLIPLKFAIDTEAVDRYITNVVAASFGNTSLTKEQLDESNQTFRAIIKALREKVSFTAKVYLVFKY